MSRDDLALEGDLESEIPEIREVVPTEEDGNFDGDCHGIIDQHEALERFVPLFICRRRRNRKRGKIGRVVFLSRNRRIDGCWKRG